MASDQIYVATETFSTNVDGVPVLITRDQTRVRAGHPLLKGRAAFFKPLTVHYDVEQATANPGEQRGAPRGAAAATPATPAAPVAAPAPTPSAPTPAPAPDPAATAPGAARSGLTTDSIKAPAK